MNRPLIAGNWKMNKLPSESVEWLQQLLHELEERGLHGPEILLNVPATHLAPMYRVAAGTAVALGGQDLSRHEHGAFTGEISGAMLRDAGASYVIVGHSERRAHHGEDDEIVAAKLAAARRHDLIPILCVGESERERDAGMAEEVVLRQLRRALEGFALRHGTELVVAYEPVWAIGTGRTATPDDAQEMGATIRRALDGRFGAAAGEVRLLYGGSMKPDNAAELLARADVDGGLIGGASLEVSGLIAIAEAAR